MNILLIDADKKMPNLALMHISRFHKDKHDKVFLNKGNNFPDKVYISCVFARNKPNILGIAKMFRCEVVLGGSGINLTTELPHEIEHLCPDYSLYGLHYSLGFTSRGCIRRCPWCVVPQKEGDIKDHAPLKEFLRHRKVILLDNNFLASPKWLENLTLLIQHKIKVNFNQGLDIRLIDKENARLLAKTHYYDADFKDRRLYFAFDIPQIEDQVVEGIRILNEAGIPSKHLMFYLLTGFNTTTQEDLHRIEVLKNLGVLPYAMVYNDRKDLKIQQHLERWVNWRFYEVCEFKDYDHGDSQKLINAIMR